MLEGVSDPVIVLPAGELVDDDNIENLVKLLRVRATSSLLTSTVTIQLLKSYLELTVGHHRSAKWLSYRLTISLYIH